MGQEVLCSIVLPAQDFETAAAGRTQKHAANAFTPHLTAATDLM